MGRALSSLLPILVLMLAAAAIESWAPFRAQTRNSDGRIATNLCLMSISILIGLMLNGVLIAGAFRARQNDWGVLRIAGIDGILAAVLTILVLDLSAYAAHLTLHRIQWLWRIHLVHHADASVDVTTSYRHHPFETCFRWSVTAVVALALGAEPAVLALYRSLSALNAILEHANIRVPSWLERALVTLWVTPDMHKIHHSRDQRETDSNYANLFSFWDRAFRTFTPSEIAARVRYGIDGFETRNSQRIRALLKLPFVRSGAGRVSPSAT